MFKCPVHKPYLIFFLKNIEDSTTLILPDSNDPENLSSGLQLTINLICFKILNNLAPDYLVDLIHVYEPARYLRSSSDKWRLVIKPYNLKTYGFRAFSVIAPILWNDLPVDIRSIDDVNKFKSKLKTFLFKRVYELS